MPKKKHSNILKELLYLIRISDKNPKIKKNWVEKCINDDNHTLTKKFESMDDCVFFAYSMDNRFALDFCIVLDYHEDKVIKKEKIHKTNLWVDITGLPIAFFYIAIVKFKENDFRIVVNRKVFMCHLNVGLQHSTIAYQEFSFGIEQESETKQFAYLIFSGNISPTYYHKIVPLFENT